MAGHRGKENSGTYDVSPHQNSGVLHQSTNDVPVYAELLADSSKSKLPKTNGGGDADEGMNTVLSTGAIKGLLAFTILFLACIVAFASRLFAVIRFESIIHEFDPWFNYRSTHHLVSTSFYDFLNWFDDRAWYPLGRIVGGTVYPGLMVTSGTIHTILNTLNIPVHIRDVCVFLAPLFSGLTSLAGFALTRELWDTSAGLMAACFLAIVPGYISRSVAGSYDNEGIAIFALLFTYYFWIKAVKTGSIAWAAGTALCYFYMVSAWGGYVFIINLIPLHVCVLLLMGRYSQRIYVAFCTFFILGTLLSMQIPFVGFQPVRTSEHMAAAGTFVLLQAYAFLKYVQDYLTKQEFRSLFFFGVTGAAGTVFLGVVFLTYTGYVAPWSGRFYSLYDTGYAKIHIPIIASVSEHQPTTWASFFFDLHVLSCSFPAGLWFVIKEINDERVFIILYAMSAAYFAGVMVRLMLTLTPVVCILASICLSKTLNEYLVDDTPKKEKNDDGEEVEEETEKKNRKLYDKAGKVRKIKQEPEKDSEGTGSNLRGFVVVAIMMMLMMFAIHCTWVTSNAYSSPSIVLATYSDDGSRVILDDFREAYYWLRQNTDEYARVMSWWDYGYQIAGMANRTTLVDNNTWNNSHIALVGKAMSSTEPEAYKIMKMLDVDYVLVIFGGVIGFSGDDINKFLWMVRIAEGEHPQDIRESDYFTSNGEFRVDKGGAPTLLNCLMYKMCYYRFGEVQLDFRTPSGYDRTRGVEIGNKDISFEHLEEAYTTQNWLVRIYKVKDISNKEKVATPSKKSKKKKVTSRKTSKKRRGQIKNKPQIKKGVRKAKNSSKKKSTS